MAIMAREVLKNHAPGGKIMSMFLSMEDAMQYIHIELEKIEVASAETSTSPAAEKSA